MLEILAKMTGLIEALIHTNSHWTATPTYEDAKLILSEIRDFLNAEYAAANATTDTNTTPSLEKDSTQ